MAYTKTIWEEYPNENTIIDADKLNNIENGIEDLDTRLTTAEGKIDNLDNVTKYITATAGSNGDFKVNIPNTLETGMIVNITFPTAVNPSANAQFSVDGGTTYYPISRPADAVQLIVSDIAGKRVTLVFTGTAFLVIAGTNLKSKIITITRNGQGANGDVSYTGVGFKPTSVKALMSVTGTLYKSNGFADSTGASYCQYTSSANTEQMADWLITYSNQSAWVQHGKVKSYNADGLTITWEKIGTPVAGTMNIYLLCER